MEEEPKMLNGMRYGIDISQGFVDQPQLHGF